MEVVIYGLYSHDWQRPEVLELPGERWVLNDWYQYGTVENPSRIFNLHQHPYINEDAGCFKGDWKAEYNQTGADVMTIEPIDGVARCRVIDTERLVRLAGTRSSLSCSIATMIWQAILEHAEAIRIVGVILNTSEHAYQAAGILNAIDGARVRGVKVSMLPLGRLTEIRKRLDHITPMGLSASVIDFTYWEWQQQLKELRFDGLHGTNRLPI